MKNTQQEENNSYDFKLSKAVEYCLFTEHEMIGAVNCFQTDFSDMFWAIENLTGIKLKKALIKSRYFYMQRYLEGGDYLSYSHQFNKLMYFLDVAFLDLRELKKGKLYDNFSKVHFEDIFRNKSNAKLIIEKLIEAKYIKRIDIGLVWIDQSRYAGISIVALFNYLIRNGYIKPEYTSDYVLFSKISNTDFLVKRSPKTFLRMNDPAQKGNWKKFAFLG